MNKFKTWADKNLQGDKVIWAVVFALSLISILVVYSSVGTLAFKRSSSPEQILIKHTMHVIIGLAAMWLAHRVAQARAAAGWIHAACRPVVRSDRNPVQHLVAEHAKLYTGVDHWCDSVGRRSHSLKRA